MTIKNPYYLIENKLPETATVSYFDIETDQNLTQEEWNQLHQNNSGEISVINKSGSDYQSSRFSINNPSYGPGQDSPNTHYCAASSCYERIEDSLTYCWKHNQVMTSQQRRDAAKELSVAIQGASSGTELEYKIEQKDSSGNYKSESLTIRKK